MNTPIPEGFKRTKLDDNTEEYFLNMGPQHPSTHGVLRLVSRLDGENVVEIVPHLGYIHRGIEKIGESQTYLQYVHLTDRMDYICSHHNNLGVVLAMEDAMEIGVPERGEYIRIIVSELQRISSHLMFWGCFGGDLGALTAFTWGFKEREKITQLFDELCGARLTMNYFRPGGSTNDLPDGFLNETKKLLDNLKERLDEFDRLITGNLIIRERTQGVGILSKEDAIGFGCSGPIARASGVNYDVRRHNPYSIYDRFDFEIPVRTEGDCLARYYLRLDEIRESMKILEQAIRDIPEGPYRSKEKTTYKLPKGIWHSQVETGKGLFGTTFIAEKGDKPYRVKTRSPNFSNLSALDTMCRGHKVADIITVLSTLDVVIPDIDR